MSTLNTLYLVRKGPALTRTLLLVLFICTGALAAVNHTIWLDPIKAHLLHNPELPQEAGDQQKKQNHIAVKEESNNAESDSTTDFMASSKDGKKEKTEYLVSVSGITLTESSPTEDDKFEEVTTATEAMLTEEDSHLTTGTDTPAGTENARFTVNIEHIDDTTLFTLLKQGDLIFVLTDKNDGAVQQADYRSASGLQDPGFTFVHYPTISQLTLPEHKNPTLLKLAKHQGIFILKMQVNGHLYLSNRLANQLHQRAQQMIGASNTTITFTPSVQQERVVWRELQG